MIESIRNMNSTRRFLFIGAAAALIVIVWVVGQWASAPTYVPLFSELDYKNAAEISDHLDKADIANQLGAGGTQVLVPASEMARARVALARDGVMAGGRPGFELMNKPAWGQTDFEQRVTFQRALEGELARTIGTIRGVQNAQVHLNLPAPTALRRNQSPAGASVVLTLAPGGSLAPDAVDGITYIVSNSVDHLSPDNVAVMDNAGRVLSIPASGGANTGMTSRQLAMQRSVEEHLGAKAERLLETVVGIGRARTQVSAQLSFDQVDRTIDTFDPNTQVLQTEQRSESEGAGAGTQTIVSNAYQNSRRLEKIVGSVGDVTRLTVAVLVDAAALDAQAGGAASGTPPVRVEDLEAMVRDAIGIDEQRGDRISVKVVPFEPVATPDAALGAVPAAGGGPDLLTMAERLSRPVIGLVAIIALLLLAFRAMKAPAFAPAPQAERSAAGAPAQLNGAAQGASVANGNSPDATADVMRAWLAERA